MKWFPGSVTTAIEVSRRQKALFVVFIESSDDKGREMAGLWDGVELAIFDTPVVGIHLKDSDVATQQFASIYPTPVLPASYFIDLAGRPLEILTLLEPHTSDTFVSRIRNTIEKFKKEALGGAAASFPASSSNASSPAQISSSPPPAAEAVAASSTQQQAAEDWKQLTVEERAQRAKKLLEEKRAREAKEKEEEEKQKELDRRNAGRIMAEAKAKREEREIAEAAAARRREKLENEAELARLRAQIKADREERFARENRAHDNEQEKPKEKEEEKTPCRSAPQTDSARIAARFPDGSTLELSFAAYESFRTTHSAVSRDERAVPGFQLAQAYPRKVFTDEDLDKTYAELGLTPSASILILQTRHGGPSSALATQSSLRRLLDFCSYIIWSPLRILQSFLGIGGAPIQNVHREPSTSVSAGSSRGGGSQDESTLRRRNVGGGGARIRQTGNVARMDNRNDDGTNSDEDASWNGNSTQFI